MPKLLTQGVSSEPETGRSLIGIVAGFQSERWPDFDRNGGRLQVGIRRRRVNRRTGGSAHGGCHRQSERQDNRRRRICGYDVGRNLKGRKRHIVTDVQDRHGAPDVLK